MTLHDYQTEALNKVKEKLAKHNRAILVAPCATGKTYMFSYLCHEIAGTGQQSLIIVHRDELVKQTLEKLEIAGFNQSMLDFEKGKQHINFEADVAVVSLQSIYKNPRMANSRINSLLEYLPRLGIVVYDECHHARAEATYDMLLYLLSMRPNAKLLGVSATPYRADVLELDEVFGEPEETWVSLDRDELVIQGYLAPFKHTYLEVLDDKEIENLNIVMGDYELDALSRLINIEKVNEVIADTVLARKNVPGVVYACNILHAENLLKEIQARGVSAALVTGSTPANERRDIIESFGTKIMCIINVMVLTEGYDAPNMQYLILARPTRSAVLYEQITGRVARIAPGKGFGEVIHLVSPRVQKRLIQERKKKQLRIRHRATQAGENLAKAILRDQYIGVMLQKCAELDSIGLNVLARSFSDLCQKRVLWLPLTGNGPLFTVIPAKPDYDAYKNAIFALAGPGKNGKVIIIACHAAKDCSPWTIQKNAFIRIDAKIAEATHRFYEWLCEEYKFSKAWLTGTANIPETFFGKESKRLIEVDLARLYSHSIIDDNRYKYIVNMSAAAEGYYKSLCAGNLFIKRSWKTAINHF